MRRHPLVIFGDLLMMSRMWFVLLQVMGPRRSPRVTARAEDEEAMEEERNGDIQKESKRPNRRGRRSSEVRQADQRRSASLSSSGSFSSHTDDEEKRRDKLHPEGAEEGEEEVSYCPLRR